MDGGEEQTSFHVLKLQVFHYLEFKIPIISNFLLSAPNELISGAEQSNFSWIKILLLYLYKYSKSIFKAIILIPEYILVLYHTTMLPYPLPHKRRDIVVGNSTLF